MRTPGFSFHEVMDGTLQRDGERFDRPFRFEFLVVSPSALRFLGTVVATMAGTVRVDGLARDAPANGTLEMSPLRQKRLRYLFEFTGTDGRRYRFDGHKTLALPRYIRSWTTLPGTLYDEQGKPYGTALLRFRLREQLRPFLRSFRLEWEPAPDAG